MSEVGTARISKNIVKYNFFFQPGDIWQDGLCKACQCIKRTDGTTVTSCQTQTCPPCQMVNLSTQISFFFKYLGSIFSVTCYCKTLTNLSII